MLQQNQTNRSQFQKFYAGGVVRVYILYPYHCFSIFLSVNTMLIKMFVLLMFVILQPKRNKLFYYCFLKFCCISIQWKA